MNRDGHNEVSFFIGTEVEHTPAFGLHTLFVTGVQPFNEITARLRTPGQHMVGGGMEESVYEEVAQGWSNYLAEFGANNPTPNQQQSATDKAKFSSSLGKINNVDTEKRSSNSISSVT